MPHQLMNITLLISQITFFSTVIGSTTVRLFSNC